MALIRIQRKYEMKQSITVFIPSLNRTYNVKVFYSMFILATLTTIYPNGDTNCWMFRKYFIHKTIQFRYEMCGFV